MITDAQLDAYGRHMRFNAFFDKHPEFTQYGCNGSRWGERLLPSELLDHKKKEKNAGFTFVIVVTDSKKKQAYVAATQDGNFWPMPPAREDGMGAQARNAWACKHLQTLYAGAPVPVDPKKELEDFTASIDRILGSTPSPE